MAALIQQFSDPIHSDDGVSYVVQAWAERAGAWQGWLVFIAADGSILRTTPLTSSSSRDMVRRWAARLPRRALTAALARAIPPSAELPAA